MVVKRLAVGRTAFTFGSCHKGIAGINLAQVLVNRWFTNSRACIKVSRNQAAMQSEKVRSASSDFDATSGPMLYCSYYQSSIPPKLLSYRRKLVPSLIL